MTTVLRALGRSFAVVAIAGLCGTAAPAADIDVGAILRLLPATDRDHVIIVRRNGSVAVELNGGGDHPQEFSLPELLDPQQHQYASARAGTTFIATYTGSKPGTVQAGMGYSKVQTQLATPFDIHTGALHGVRSVNGWSAERVTVTVPCGVRRALVGWRIDADGTAVPVDLETGYVYIGGWGGGPYGAAVDAGLQKSSQQWTGDDYATYWKFSSNSPVTFPIARRYHCSDDASDYVTLELRPLNDQLLAFTSRGRGPNGEPLVNTVVQLTAQGDGWWRNGGTISDGIILKRMVTIAQPPDWHNPQSAAFRPDGWRHDSYFGIRSSNGTPALRWGTCEIGNVALDGQPTYHAWRAADTWAPSNAIQNYPFGGVLFSRPVDACEITAIDLRRTVSAYELKKPR